MNKYLARRSFKMQKEKSKSGSDPNENENEKIIRTYFKSYGCEVTRLEEKVEGKKADFLISNNDGRFLCEAKSLKSVHSYLPLKPSLGSRGRYTEDKFNKFVNKIKKRLESSSIKNLPFSLRIDSSPIYAPKGENEEEEELLFFNWLETEIQAIHDGRPSRCWHIEISVPDYSTSYPIHKPVDKNDSKGEYELQLTRLPANSKFQIEPHLYGGLNLESLDGAMQDGLEQLQASASREQDPQIPRIIALAFESVIIGSEWEELSSFYTYFFITQVKQ